MKMMFGIKKLSEMPGGSERVLCIVASALAQRGHCVTIITFDTPGGKPFYDLDKKINVIDLNIGNSASPTTLFESLRRMFSLRNRILSEQPDVVVGFNPSIFLLMGPALICSGIPVIGSEHIVPNHFEHRSLQLIFYRIVSRLLVKITVLSERIRKTYPKSIREKMVPLTNPVVPLPNFEIPLIKSNRKTILNVGRLDEQKDQATLIRAFAHVAKSFPSWDLKIIGEGHLREKLLKIANSFSLGSRIQFPGITQSIHEEYGKCDIFALSSEYESFGLVTIEAMQHKKPVLAFTDCPGTNEIIETGRTGLLVEPNEDRVKAFALGLAKLMADGQLRDILGGNAQIEVASRFDSEQVIDSWESLLFDVALER